MFLGLLLPFKQQHLCTGALLLQLLENGLLDVYNTVFSDVKINVLGHSPCFVKQSVYDGPGIHDV